MNRASPSREDAPRPAARAARGAARWIPVALLALAAGGAAALDIHVRAHGDEAMGKVEPIIEDLITERFAAYFPPTMYTLFVFVDHHRLGDDNLCYAMVGVTRSTTAGRQSRLPAMRFTSAYLDRGSADLSPSAKRGCLAKALRHAVKAVMDTRPEEIFQGSGGAL